MIEKILIFNITHWNQVVCSLIEGLKANKDLKLFSTTDTNYAADIAIKNQPVYFVIPIFEQRNYRIENNKIISGTPPDIQVNATVTEKEKYVGECKNLMKECDLIIIFDRGDLSSAYFYIPDENGNVVPTIDRFGRENTSVDCLHKYAIKNYKDKIALINPNDWASSGEMYGKYEGGFPQDCKIYFKREKSLDLQWEDNVHPIPFSTEERYFTGGKNFNNIWNNKILDVACLFRDDIYNKGQDLKRRTVKRVVKEHCNIMGNIKYVIGSIKDDISVEPNYEIEKQLSGIDISSKKYEYEDVVGKPRHHHSTYYKVLLKSRINIEGLPGQEAFYTGLMMESLANGCCYFYPKPNYRVDFPNGLIDGEDFIIYETPEDLIERIHYYLHHPNEMKVIAENGFNKLLKYHTSEVRAKEFLETCERYMND